MRTTQYQIDRAREALTVWTIRRAARLARDVGFSYEPVAEGHPETYAAVRAEYAACLRERRGFRVWAGESDRTIYTNPEGNYAFRYVHDVFHACFAQDFTTAGEFAVSLRHVAEVSKAFGADSIEARLVHEDTIGQALHFARTGQFVEDQQAFVFGRILSMS